MKLIAVQERNGGIGINGGLLMSLPTDMKYFRTETMGKTVIMGRKTLESFPGGKPLPKRRNIVLSTTLKQSAGYEVCRSVDELTDLLSEEEKKEAFVIGGGQIYKLLLPLVKEAYITEIDAELDADTFIPVFKNLEEWKCVSVSDTIEENGVKYAFAVYRRNE
jgi:dihydrofolate reductase